MVILPRLSNKEKKAATYSINIMNKMASQGLRTLMFGVKDLTN